MTTSLVSATRISTPTRGGLRYIPTVAFGTDMVVVTLSVFAAILGRSTIPFPMGGQELQVGDSLSVAGPLMIMGWVGGHLRSRWLPPEGLRRRPRRVQEHRQRVPAHRRGGRDQLLPGPVRALPRLLRARLRHRHPDAGAGPLPAPPQRAPGPRPRRPAAPRGDRRLRGPRRRDRQRAAPRDLAGLPRGRRAHPRPAGSLDHPLRHPAARLLQRDRRDRHRRRGRHRLPRRWRSGLRHRHAPPRLGPRARGRGRWSSPRA